SPAWQKCQCREVLAWHSQVFTVTSPSAQCGKRLNLNAACASVVSRKADTQTRAIRRAFILAPYFSIVRAHCDATQLPWRTLGQSTQDDATSIEPRGIGGASRVRWQHRKAPQKTPVSAGTLCPAFCVLGAFHAFPLPRGRQRLHCRCDLNSSSV